MPKLNIPKAREQALRAKIQEELKARKRSGPHDGHNRKIAAVLLPRMTRTDNYTNEDLGVILEHEGHKYSSVGPATTWMVREGYLDRVARGTYRKLREWDAQ